ncbi:MAG: agmatinase [Candidatus Saganbacteria bacterium]|uniref:Agmatinase n=1 Tax=Candidatus Saganbacteria bacterium TaxID=2575572 RepID=A0A833L069_UNCSA|nr:MAG: agmatinase [Candidatus Saganbacteria bacterium]
MSNTFLEIEPEYSRYNTSKFVVVPCPHETSTSYGKGTKNGPQAILNASYNIENFDEELKFETYKKAGIHTMTPCSAGRLPSTINKILKDKKTPIVLGGEHSITPYAVEAVFSNFPKLSVLQFDAHADLRDKYHGNKNSHACAMRRTLEICPVVQVGIRNISPEEYEFAQKSGQINNMHFANQLESVEKAIAQLSEYVYITFDVDAFDSSVMPSTGTPEPGGFFWYEVLNILKLVAKNKKVVAADFVELMPIKGFSAPDFTVAKLIYKLMGYLSR